MTSDAEADLRVASVPTSHPYVRAALAEAGRVQLRPEPEVPGRAPGQWWPPVLLDPAYLRAHAAGIDVLHLHFGMESLPEGRLDAAFDELRALRIPLVYTLHDLANPQLIDQREHLAQVESAVRNASELITLTPGAAAEIRRRWGREATVIPHPRLASGGPAPADRVGGGVVVGVHLRDLRPNIAGETVVRMLAAAVTALRDGGRDVTARIRMNTVVRDAAAADSITRIAASTPGLELERGERQTDAQLEQWVADVDAVVLPYSHSTHSGFAELCWDLGVPVIDSGRGHIAEQHPDDTVVFDLDDQCSMTDALASVRAAEPSDRRRLVADRCRERAAESIRIGRAHREIYLRARGRIA